MTTEEDFHRALDANPADWQTRLVFADWLQERDDPRADGYRALGVLRRTPHGYGDEWGFDSERTNTAYDGDELPHDWFTLVKRPKPHGSVWGTTVRVCRTRGPLEDAAARAFAQLPAKRRAQLLAARWAPKKR